MLENGFVKIYRSLLKWEWYDDINTKVVFLHLLLTVSIEDSKWHGITVKRGSRVSSYAILAKETKLSIDMVRTAIKHLESTGEITRYKYPKYTVFTVNNYDKFQNVPSILQDDSQGNPNVIPKSSQQYKKVKEDKEEKEDITVNQVVDLYHEICKSYPRLRGISENRRKAISARCKIYRIEDFRIVFQNAENSGFLKGGNDRNWSANFDWMMKDTNFVKILEGRYNGGNNDTFAVSDSRGCATADTTESANDGEGLI